MIKAAIFDRDGVLTNFDNEAAVAFFEPILPISIYELSYYWQQWGQKVGFPTSLMEEAAFWQSFWKYLGEELGLSATAQTKLQHFDYTVFIRPYQEAHQALKAVRQRGLRTGVLANFTLASLDESLVTAGLADLVDVACAAPVLGVAKPHPDAYLLTARELGVEPEACLFFDDELPCVEGARNVGMQAYHVDRDAAIHGLSQGMVRDLSAMPFILDRVEIAPFPFTGFNDYRGRQDQPRI